MKTEIDEKRLREAKEKLACHIQPPGTHSAWADAVSAAADGQVSGSAGASGGQNGAQSSDSDAECGASCSTADPVPMRDGKVRLTQMTSAGG